MWDRIFSVHVYFDGATDSFTAKAEGDKFWVTADGDTVMEAVEEAVDQYIGMCEAEEAESVTKADG